MTQSGLGRGASWWLPWVIETMTNKDEMAAKYHKDEKTSPNALLWASRWRNVHSCSPANRCSDTLVQ